MPRYTFRFPAKASGLPVSIQSGGVEVTTSTVGSPTFPGGAIEVTAVLDEGTYEAIAEDARLFERYTSPGVATGAFGIPGVIIFNHDANAAAIRPVTDAIVVWTGTVEPDNMIDDDIWFNSSANIAPEMPAGLVADFYVTDLSALSNGATVSTWSSRTGSYDLTPTAGTPTYQSSDPAVVFASSAYMDAPIALSQPDTVVAVFQLNSSGVSQPIIGSSTSVHAISTTASQYPSISAGTALSFSSGTVGLNQWYYGAAVFNGASSRNRFGAVSVTGNAGTNARTNLRIAANSSASSFSTMKLKAVLVFDTALTDQELSDVRTLVSTELGIAL